MKGGTLNDSTDPLLTCSLQKYGVITDNLIPSLEGSGFSGWKVVESSDAGFKPDQLYQASEINNHEFTGNVAFEAVWDINMYTVNVEMVNKEVPANVLDSKLWSRCPLGREPEADGRLNGLIPESIDGTDGNHYIYTGMMYKSYEPVQGVRKNGTAVTLRISEETAVRFWRKRRLRRRIRQKVCIRRCRSRSSYPGGNPVPLAEAPENRYGSY